MNSNLQADSHDQSNPWHRSTAEWVTFSVAAIILATVMGLVLYSWFSRKDKPPILSVVRERPIRQVNQQYYVPFTLVNEGGETAESVHVSAQLKINNQEEESGEQEIDFLSSGEQEEGAFVFSQNPAQGQLTIRVSSYKLP